jgi:hypothetical protein
VNGSSWPCVYWPWSWRLQSSTSRPHPGGGGLAVRLAGLADALRIAERPGHSSDAPLKGLKPRIADLRARPPSAVFERRSPRPGPSPCDRAMCRCPGSSPASFSLKLGLPHVVDAQTSTLGRRGVCAAGSAPCQQRYAACALPTHPLRACLMSCPPQGKSASALG